MLPEDAGLENSFSSRAARVCRVARRLREHTHGRHGSELPWLYILHRLHNLFQVYYWGLAGRSNLGHISGSVTGVRQRHHVPGDRQ
jgi:hypothetical protein